MLSKISEPKSKNNYGLDSDVVFKFDREKNSDELYHNYEGYELEFDSYSNGVIESDSNWELDADSNWELNSVSDCREDFLELLSVRTIKIYC